ncbi:hypothetical protein G6549_08450 [Bacillus sp. MM2020_1]|nr:hypothetical protein [Bacillus sp. MM2020_1]
MIKKFILVIMASVLFITGCQAVKGVDLNKMILSNSKINSAESKTTATLDLKYTKSKVTDKDFLKVLNLLDNAKVEFQTKMQDSSTVSMTGNLTLKQKGKIQFRLYMDKKQVVLLLDNAKKPIRISIDNSSTPNDQLIKDLQTKLLAPVVKNLPNPFPAHLTVKNNITEKVHGAKVTGHKVHAEVFANEIPKLLETFLNNLLKDEKSIQEIVNAINELSKSAGETTAITTEDFKNGIQQVKTEILPELKKPEYSSLLTKKNNFKTDLFLDKKFYERKSSSVLTIGSIPDADGLTGVTVRITNETWNINKKVIASKIKYTSFLKADATPEQVMATLDKRHSVLYSVMSSFMYEPSKALKTSQVRVINNYGKKLDTITVKGIRKGDVIKIYSTSGIPLAGKQSTGSTVTLSVKQIGKKSGKVYVSIIRSKKAESTRVSVTFKSEKK